MFDRFTFRKFMKIKKYKKIDGYNDFCCFSSYQRVFFTDPTAKNTIP